MKALKEVWPNLPVLLTGSVLVALAWTLARVIGVSSAWAYLLFVGLVVLPVFAALLRGCEVLLVGDHFGIGSLLRSLPRSFARSLRITVPVLVVVLLGDAGTYAWRTSGNGWLLPSAVLCGVVGLAAIYVGLVALPYYTAGRASWAQSWLVSLYIATRNPVPVLATLSAVVLGVLAAAHLSFALVLLLPAPIALVWASAMQTATGHSQDLLHAKGHEPR